MKINEKIIENILRTSLLNCQSYVEPNINYWDQSIDLLLKQKESYRNKTEQDLRKIKAGKINRYISNSWVLNLAYCLKVKFCSNQDVKILPDVNDKLEIPKGENREFLFDIHILKMGMLEYSNKKGILSKLVYPKESLLAVESEFSDKPREYIKDFAKLLCSSSNLKIFVGPYMKEEDNTVRYLGILRHLAGRMQIKEGLYLLLTSHPRDIIKNKLSYRIFNFSQNDWNELQHVPIFKS